MYLFLLEPMGVGGLTVSQNEIGTGSLHLTWVAPAVGVFDGYRVLCSEEGGAEVESLTTRDEEVLIPGLKAGTLHKIQVLTRSHEAFSEPRVVIQATSEYRCFTPRLSNFSTVIIRN